MYTMAGQFRVTESFLEAYVPWYKENDRTPAINRPEFQGYNSRRQVQLIKLSMIFSAMTMSGEHERLVQGKHFKMALSLLEETEKTMPRVFSGYGDSDRSDVLARIMTFIATREKVTKSDLMTRFHADLDGQMQLDEIIDSMRVMGFVNVKEGANSRRTILLNKDHEYANMFDS